jgi:hypothetical protein
MNIFTIAFEMLKVPYAGEGFIPAEAVRIVIVPCLSFKKFTHREAKANTLLTLTAIIRSHSFKFDSLIVPY